MKKIKYLTPILGLSAMVGVAAPIATSCAKAVETTILPYNLLNIDGVTLKGLVSGTDLTKYDTIDIPEGVKYIDVDSFNHAKVVEPNEESESTFDYSTIKKLILPSTLRGVNDAAFVGLTALSSIDCTSWTGDTIQYMDFAPNSINPSGYEDARYMKINLPEGLTLNQTEKVKADFAEAGVPAYCFVDQTTGHISATEGVSKTVNTTVSDETTIFEDPASLTPYQYANGDANVSLTLAETFDTDKYELKLYTQKTAASAYYDDVDYLVDPVITDYKTVTFTPIMFNTLELEEEPEEIYYPMLESEGHTVDYDINVVCTKKSTNEVVWTEKVEGFKLTNTYQHVSKLTYTNKPAEGAYQGYVYADPRNFAEQEITPSITIEPTNAVVKTYSYSTDDENIIFIDDNNKVASKNPGTANLVVKTDDTLSAAQDSVQVDIYKVILEENNVPTTQTVETPIETGSVRSYAGYDTDKTESYGHTLPATDSMYKMDYEITLNGSGTTASYCPEVYVPYTSGQTTTRRSFGIYKNSYTGGKYWNTIVTDVYAATVHVTRSDETEYDLEYGTHYTIEDGKVYLADKSDDSQTIADITFVAGDTLTFSFYLTNLEPILYTGFEFHVID